MEMEIYSLTRFALGHPKPASHSAQNLRSPSDSCVFLYFGSDLFPKIGFPSGISGSILGRFTTVDFCSLGGTPGPRVWDWRAGLGLEGKAQTLVGLEPKFGVLHPS